MAEENGIAEPSFVLLGTIVRPHGIKGELKVRPFTAQPEDFGRYPRLYLSESEQGPKRLCNKKQARISSNQVILCLQECDSRDRAESLVGSLVWIPAEDLPPLEMDEFYLHTLIGKHVRTVDGQQLGRAENLLSGSGQELLVIRLGKEEHLIPIVKAFIHEITADFVTLDLPDGLLEING